MKKIALMIILFAAIFVYVSAAAAQDQEDKDSSGSGWEDVFTQMLEKGKASAPSDDAVGLAYTPAEASVLEEAVSYALSGKEGSRACECMKIAVDLDYNPYLVLKTIYGLGGHLEIDQVCSCATESGVSKAIIAQAAADAVSLLNEPVYDVDEVARSQCLAGLAYQTDPGDPPPPPPPPPVSTVIP